MDQATFGQVVAALMSPEVSQEQKAQAMAYYEQVQNSPDGWAGCATIFSQATLEAGNESLRFQCLRILEHALHNRYSEVTPELVTFIKEMCHAWMGKVCDGGATDQPYIKNKVSQVYVYIFVNQYPHACPTFFTDLIGEVNSKGPAMMDIFFRILDAIDELVVSREVQTRSQAELERNTAIKDAMRVDSLPAVADTWYRCLVAYSTSSPDLASMCLHLVTKYVSWVDITLVVNEQILGELYKLIPGNADLRTAACDCLFGVVTKGMPHLNRCQLIASLNLSDSIATWVQGITDDDENQFAIALGRLYNMTGILLIEAIEGLASEGQDASSALTLFQQMLPRLTDFLGNEYDDISESVMPLVHKYIKLLEKTGIAEASVQQSVGHLAQVIIQKMRFDEEHDFVDEGDDEEDFYEYRKTLGRLLTDVYAILPDAVMQLAGQCVQANLNAAALSAGQLSPLDVELALHVIYELAAMVRPRQFSDGQASVLIPFMRAAMESNVASYPHHGVQLTFFELCWRCADYFKLVPAHLGGILLAFLGPQGVKSPLPSLRSFAAYRFAKVVYASKDLVHQCLQPVLERLHPLLQIDYTGGEQALTCEDRVHLFEGMGYIMMGAGISVTDQAQMLGTLLAPLLEQYKAITETFCTSQDPKVQAQCAVLLDHIPSALTSLCKRMTTAFLDACGCRPNLVAALEVFVAALERMIHSDKVRHGIRVFMQQMITCMGDSLIPATPAFLRAMFSGGLCGVEELRDMMTLVGQMISKFKQKLSPVLDQAILPLVQAIFATLQSEVDPQDTNAVEEM